MYSGKTNQVAKLWTSIGGQQIDSIPANTTVTGDAPRADGYVYIRTPKTGYTKKIWLDGYLEIPVTPPPPPPPTGIVLTHTIEIYEDGSLKIDGTTYP